MVGFAFIFYLLADHNEIFILKASSIYDFNALDIDGHEVSLSKYANHVCIIVNVASIWGDTAVNYTQLVALQKKYAETDGLRILAFPSNQFASEEPGTNAEIKAFAASKGVEFGKGFDFFAKIDVIGDNAHPLWKYLKSQQGIDIEWNFAKFVIDKKGIPVAGFSSINNPIPPIPDVEEAVKKLFWVYFSRN